MHMGIVMQEPGVLLRVHDGGFSIELQAHQLHQEAEREICAAGLCVGPKRHQPRPSLLSTESRVDLRVGYGIPKDSSGEAILLMTAARSS